ncbi:MAG: ASKHA domain-containing protein [Methanomassiliicoccales archaeon]
MEMIRVRFEPTGKIVEVDKPGESLFEIAMRAGVPIESVCGGRGSCGRCRVVVTTKDAPISQEDAKFISKNDLMRGVRLACKLIVEDDLVIDIPEEYEKKEQIILVKSFAHVDTDPTVKKITIQVPPPTIDFPLPDFERLKNSIKQIGGFLHIPLKILSLLPDYLRKNSEAHIVLRHDEILGLTEKNEGVYGIAVDIGTTTVVAYLIDLVDGRELAVESDMNPQIKYGDDVISRITFRLEREEGVEILRNQIVSCINDLINRCATLAGIKRDEIYEVVIVGNTVMHHLFWGLEVQSFAFSPYIPVVARSLEEKAKVAGVEINEEGYVYSLPNIGGFVGADHVGVLLAVRADESQYNRLAIDIGTNGEISVITPGRIISASCAAGPAFEGGCLRFGMRGARGAIDHVKITENLGVKYSVIGNTKPRGICGSGIVDAIAEMVRLGIIDRSGRIMEEIDSPRIGVQNGESYFIVAFEDETAVKEPIVITQNDVLQIQFAKAAMYAGTEILMKMSGISDKEIDEILLAGAFGNYIDPANARMIGIFPEVPLDHIVSIGNAAGSGAKMALLNNEMRKKAEEIARKVEYIELAAQPDFEEAFYSALYFPHNDLTRFPIASSEISTGKRDFSFKPEITGGR